jgi:hypothetical protein
MPVQFQQSVPIPRECSLEAKAAVSKTAIASSSLASPATSGRFAEARAEGIKLASKLKGSKGWPEPRITLVLLPGASSCDMLLDV